LAIIIIVINYLNVPIGYGKPHWLINFLLSISPEIVIIQITKGGKMYERIIVPLDGSEVGEAALPYVEDLISKLSPEVKVEVTLLQVLSPSASDVVVGAEGYAVAYTEEQITETTKKAIDYLNKAGEALRDKGVAVVAKVAIGNAADEIKKASDEINADLIAMSTHGRSGLSRLAFGSIADRVLRGENKPILLVRASKKD
jgi:nucleotide-binding universal stress UspA family protein